MSWWIPPLPVPPGYLPDAFTVREKEMNLVVASKCEHDFRRGYFIGMRVCICAKCDEFDHKGFVCNEECGDERRDQVGPTVGEPGECDSDCGDCRAEESSS